MLNTEAIDLLLRAKEVHAEVFGTFGNVTSAQNVRLEIINIARLLNGRTTEEEKTVTPKHEKKSMAVKSVHASASRGD